MSKNTSTSPAPDLDAISPVDVVETSVSISHSQQEAGDAGSTSSEGSDVPPDAFHDAQGDESWSSASRNTTQVPNESPAGGEEAAGREDEEHVASSSNEGDAAAPDPLDDGREKDGDAAMRWKADGNENFGRGAYDEACACYTEALMFAPRTDEFVKQRAVFYANRGACHLQLKRFEEAIEDCDAALDLDESYVKALLRRATALERMEKLDEALQDFEDALEMDPTSSVARGAKRRLEAQIKERDERMKEEMLEKLKGMGNTLLGKFGLSLDNFKMEQDPNTGGYSVQFQQQGDQGGAAQGGGAQGEE